jgi:mannose-6-phosphate isomerase-like protein (cupin superfamily)
VKTSLSTFAALVVCTVISFAQAGGGPLIRHKAPTDRALDLPADTLKAEFLDMAKAKRITTRLIEAGEWSLNARHIVGTEGGQVHKSIIELYFIQEGSATLVTGRKIVDKQIVGGVERVVKPGDIIYIPPTIPHGFKNSPGISYVNIHFGGHD